MKETKTRKDGITLRALLLSVILIPLNCYWLTEVEVIRSSFATLVVPLFNVLFFILVLILLNFGLSKIYPRVGLRQGELMAIYVMLSVASALCSQDIMGALIGTIVHGFGLATPENDWKALFGNDLPGWLTIQDARILKGYYQGGTTFYRRDIVLAWLSPTLLWWTGFIILLTFVMICINALVRKQWTERERLTYPIIQLPLEMTSGASHFFKNRVMWLGFALAASISLLNGLHHFWPAIPYLPVTRRFFSFPDKPLSLFGTIIIAFYPFAIGLGFLIPQQLLFSTLVFYGLYRGQVAFGKVMGWHSLPDFPYRSEQSFGAILGIIIYLFLVGRGHLLQILQNFFRSESSKGEPLPYHFAILGVIIGFSLLALFLIQIGMAIGIAVTFLAIYLMLGVVITRMRAEAGFFVHQYFQASPIFVLMTALGGHRLGKRNLVAFAMQLPFNHTRSHIMPHQLEAYQIASKTRSSSRRMVGVILWATLLGAIATFWIQLHLYYKYGATSGYFAAGRIGEWSFRRLENWLSYPSTTDWPGVFFMGGGVLLTVGMILMRLRFFWWPFHPLGYVMATDGEMSDLWMVVLISFLLKWLILRCGGLKAYRKALPFFLGLILGEYVMGSLWSILSAAFSTRIYWFYP